MGRKHREAMAAARARLNDRYRDHGSLAGTEPCQAFTFDGRCDTPTTKTVIWPGSGPPIPACSLRCATALAGNDHFSTARWG